MGLSARQIDLKNIDHVKQIVLDIDTDQNRSRKREAWRLNQCKEGNQKEYVEKALASLYPETHSKFRKADINITLKVDNKLSKAYKQSPLRAGANESDTKFINETYHKYKFERAFKEADSIFNMHKYVALWLTWQNPDDKLRIDEGSYVLHALKPYDYDLVRDQVTGVPVVFIQSTADTDVTELAGNSDGVEQLISENQSDTSAQSKIYYLWDKVDYVEVLVKRSNNRNDDTEDFKINFIDKKKNTLGRLPIVYLQADSSVDYPVSNNITNQSIDWNVSFSDLKTAASTQGHGQLVIKHPEGQKLSQVHMGMHTAISLPQSKKPDSHATEADYISASPDLAGQLEVLKFDIINILDDHGIKAKGTIEGGTDKFASGFDRLLSEADVQDIIEDNQSLYALILEQGVFDILKAYELAMNTKVLRSSKEIEVTFEKPKVLISDKETLDNIKAREELDTILPWEKHIILNPNLTEKQAKKREEEIQALKEERIKKQLELTGGNEEEDEDEDELPPKDE